MSKKESLTINREAWESMRYLDKKSRIKQRYIQILEMNDEDLEVDLLLK